MCLFCGSTDHDHVQCKDPRSEEVKKVLKQVRESLTDHDEDVEMEQEQEPGPEKKESAPQGQPEGPKVQQARVGEYYWYENSVSMPEVGDLDEGGCFCIEGRRIDQEGPKTTNEFNNVVNDAVMRGGGDTWKVKDFIDAYPDTNIRKSMYRRIEAPETGFLKIVPITGCFFYHYPIYSGVEYDTTTRLETTTDSTSMKMM